MHPTQPHSRTPKVLALLEIDLLLLHTSVTWALVGLIWTIQLVQYPGFAIVGDAEFSTFHTHHGARISWIVGPLMLSELASALALLRFSPPGISQAYLWSNLTMIVFIWACTALVAMPLHKKLSGRERPAQKALVATNWLRTTAWSARGAMTIFALREVVEQA